MDITAETCSDGGEHEFRFEPARNIDDRTLVKEGRCDVCGTERLDYWEWDGESYDYEDPDAECTGADGHIWDGPASDLGHESPNIYVGYESCSACGARRSLTFRHDRTEYAFPGE